MEYWDAHAPGQFQHLWTASSLHVVPAPKPEAFEAKDKFFSEDSPTFQSSMLPFAAIWGLRSLPLRFGDAMP